MSPLNRHITGKGPISVQIIDPQPGDRMRDEDAEMLANPILDRLPPRRGNRQVKGVLAILDQLNREGATR